ncbi:MAG: DUF4126 domain-containing protein [Candidatus Omnitrophica bacterium]|jgi:hypothetical protein|nr:DUF4126 domain-containing protein [Candidatus Omnitrophota bacterium]MDD4012891.1 DUF4126 domain-containing protein [Candidatus Omnitrophota bacterium]
MNTFSTLGLILGGSWASGINLYLTIAGLGIAGRLGILELPGGLSVLENPILITMAVLIYAIEFFADKIPLVDSVWDSFHTFIRPFGAGLMGYLATTNAGGEMQMGAALLCGSVALDAHLTKATARAAINTSPEPFTNIAASVSEDALVFAALWLIVRHPVIASILVISFIVFSIWFLRVMFRFLKKILSFFFGQRSSPDYNI